MEIEAVNAGPWYVHDNSCLHEEIRKNGHNSEVCSALRSVKILRRAAQHFGGKGDSYNSENKGSKLEESIRFQVVETFKFVGLNWTFIV